jgi:DNA polymerase III subunit delta'
MDAAMAFSSIVGQPRAVEALRAALRSGGVHHAYLFGGPEGVGKELTAIAFAQALTCPEQGEGCGECHACKRVARRSHPDVTWVMPEDEQVARGLAGRSDFSHVPSRDIRVEQVRGLQERLSFRPLEARRKVAIVASAHAMNAQAQNAFLKTLEEPPPDTVLVLLASSPDKLLPTIRSRCSKVHFGPLPTSFLAERVKRERKVDDATAALVAVMAAGSMARALELDVEGLERRKEVVTRFEALRRDDARPWLRFAEDFGGSRGDAEDCLRVLSLWTRDVAALGAGAEEIVNSDLLEAARSAAAKASPAALQRRGLLLDQTQNAVTSRNGSPRLQLERMLIELMS